MKIIPLFVMVILISGFTPSINLALANPGSGTLFVTSPHTQELYEIDPTDGSIIVVGTTQDLVPVDIGLPSLAVHPITGIMYAGGGGPNSASDNNNKPNLYIVDKTSGYLTLQGPTGEGNLVGLDFSLDGTLFAAVNPPGGAGGGEGATHLGTVNTATGDTTIIGPFGVDRLNTIAFDLRGILFGVKYQDENGDGSLFQINTSTGEATFLTVIGDGSDSFGASQFACDGTYFLGEGDADDKFGTVNLSSGAFNQISEATTPSQETLGGLAYDSGCPIGGNLLPIDTTALLLAGFQTNAIWMLPIVLSAAGIGAFVLRKKK